MRAKVTRTQALMRTCNFAERNVVKTCPGTFDHCDPILRYDLPVGGTQDLFALGTTKQSDERVYGFRRRRHDAREHYTPEP